MVRVPVMLSQLARKLAVDGGPGVSGVQLMVRNLPKNAIAVRNRFPCDVANNAVARERGPAARPQEPAPVDQLEFRRLLDRRRLQHCHLDDCLVHDCRRALLVAGVAGRVARLRPHGRLHRPHRPHRRRLPHQLSRHGPRLVWHLGQPVARL